MSKTQTLRIIIEGEPMSGKTTVAEMVRQVLEVQLYRATVENHDSDREKVKPLGEFIRRVSTMNRKNMKVEIHTRMTHPPAGLEERE